MVEISDKFQGLIFNIGGNQYPLQQAAIHWFALTIIFAVVFVIIGKKFKKANPLVAPSGMLLMV